ncbi:hypothetical protein MP228_001698 [Amoeboaphelidium protococcarum]|nr:hypothetical protein MP228_001698 [Amoeboaphelidium protococcarum]
MNFISLRLVLVSVLQYVVSARIVTLRHMELCLHLEGTQIDVNSQLFKEAAAQSRDISTYLDHKAYHLYQQYNGLKISKCVNSFKGVSNVFHRACPKKSEIRRLACYQTINSAGSSIVSIDASRYFPQIPFESNQKLLQQRKDQCTIGFNLLVHYDIESVKRLVKVLTTPTTLFVIHVDAKNQIMFQELQSHYAIDQNIFVISVQDVRWGHSSIVMAQHAGYFILQDAGPCEFYINLSGDSYPLVANEQIIFRLRWNRGTSWFRQWTFADDKWTRLKGPHTLSSEDGDFAGYLPQAPWMSYQSRGLVPWKADQWQILSNSFVRMMRNSQEAIIQLAQMEFMLIPDEVYYPTISGLMPSDKVLRTHFMYTDFGLFPTRPRTFQDDETQLLDYLVGKQYMFIRKLGSNSALKDYIDGKIQASYTGYQLELLSREVD